MSINLNSEILADLPESLVQSSRAMDFGDGLFETIRVFKGCIPFLHLHWARLEAGMHVLGFDIPEAWSEAFFRREILKIVQGNARVRIRVWRSPGGLYFPTDNRPIFQITASALDSATFNLSKTGLKVRRCDKVRLPLDALSGLKTLGGTRYVMATLEARAKAVDDVILLNEFGHVCEASSSNIAWIKGETVYAPAPTDGQVSGTFQKTLFELLRGAGVTIIEKPTTFAELLGADEVLLTNAIQGIRWIQLLEGKALTCNKILNFNKLAVRYLEGLIP